MNKKILISVIFSVILCIAGYFGYSTYASQSEDRKAAELVEKNRQEAISHFGDIAYVEGDKASIRKYAAKVLTPIYLLNQLNKESYDLLLERIQYGDIKYEALDWLTDDQIVLYQLVIDYHSALEIPIEMKEVHEEVLVGLYEFTKVDDLIDGDMDKQDFEQINKHIEKMNEIVENAPKKDSRLKWNEARQQFDYLINQ